MEHTVLMNTIDQVIDEKYTSRCEPNFSFVREEIARQPYKSLMNKLREFLTVVENTDPNDDVCFSYFLESAVCRWILQLSMLAKYAVLLRIAENDAVHEVLTIESPDKDFDERRIKELLTNSGIILLSKKNLEQPIDLVLFNTEIGNAHVYQALFSDTDVLPWQAC